jgi:two-component system cell cycle sensor histidine kinase/response regulator CckA
MTKRKKEASSDAKLRLRAEQHMAKRGLGEGAGPPSPPDPEKLFYELQVHKIELEMQNEELVRSRAEVDASLARYSELYDFAPVGYFTLDREGTIRQANLTGARLLGVARSEVVARRFGMFVAAADTRAFNALLGRALESGNMESGEITLAVQPTAPGRPPFVHLTLSASAAQEECRMIVVDFTERHRAAEQLRSGQKMEAIGQLAGGVAHDFNNLLTIILSHAAFALEAVDGDSPIHEDLLELQAAAERAVALTRQLLTFSRKQELRPQVVDANQLVRGLESMLRRLLAASIDLVLRLAPNPTPIEVDPVQFEQVVMNLAINARDAMPEGGQLTVSTANVDFDETRIPQYSTGEPGQFVRMTVSDTGVGMDKATLEHIFEPFFTTKEKERGTGFGLSTVYGIVTQCGGDVSVHSEAGRGTAFDIRFARAAMVSSPRHSMVVAKTEVLTGGTETVLVVEDEDALRRAARRILEAAGYTVLVAASGEEALRVCEKHQGTIHLALSDVVMPKITGLAFAALVKAARPEIKVLHMSGYAGDAIDKYGTLDRARYIGKPFTSEALTRKVREVLDLPQNARFKMSY